MGEGQFLDFVVGHRAHGGPPVTPPGKTLHISCMVMSSEVTNTLSIPTV